MDEMNNLIENIEEGTIMKDTRAKIDAGSNDKLINERMKGFINFLKKPKIWVIGFLIIAIILGVYIRSMPMQDHNPNVPGNQPGLWDVSTNTWTLGPDLDPWLFTRTAKSIIETGSVPKIDTMRNVPLGFDNTKETMLLPYMIAYTHYFFNIFGDYPVEFSAAILPVIMFALTIISFFLFVREIFTNKSKKGKTRANIISLISTFFMIVIPVFISRTIAGIPEKESAAFFFMFLGFYLFLKSWKSEKLKTSMIFGILAGVSTALMGLISGLVIYLFIPIATTCLIAFLLNKIKKKETISYGLWVLFSFGTLLIFSNRFTLRGMLTSLSSGLASLMLFILIIHILLWNTKISKNKFLKNSQLPKQILSLILSVILLIILASLFFGPTYIIEKIKAINQILFKPVTGRWNTTVAENRQPYFVDWVNSFGPFLKNIPLVFWMFFISSLILFKKMLNKIRKKDSWILTGIFALFLIGLIFSRYSSSSIFNGDNFISKSFYYVTTLLLIGSLIYYYFQYHKKKDSGFEKIKFEYLILLVLFVFTVFTARSGVRLVMVLGPISSIFIGYLIIESFSKFKKTKDETGKMVLGILLILILLASIFSFYTFYQTSKVQAYNMVPSHYNQQWQNAMGWVREETPQDSVFGHWWDYGYWLQSIGERSTVLDGGNAIAYWNYLMGRHVLTGDNQKDALEFLYNHDTTHLLIDSSDIGKYGAYSSIGSNEDYDRFSWMGFFLLDESQTKETQNSTNLIYTGGITLDEDLIVQENGAEILIPSQNAGVGAIIIPSSKEDAVTTTFKQPSIIIIYNGKQYSQNLRYLFIAEEFIDFGSGIESVAYIFPKINQDSQGLTQNPIGAAMFLSPRLTRGMMVQKYLLKDPFNNFPNFNLIHTEQNLIIESLRNQGMDLPELIYFQGIQGPIKIWEIAYTGEEKIKEEYQDTDPNKYLSWQL
jgi:asparagine N-glycosylation enzyme membrane subunit Stt3